MAVCSVEGASTAGTGATVAPACRAASGTRSRGASLSCPSTCMKAWTLTKSRTTPRVPVYAPDTTTAR
jgi:hypothetical protein